MCDRKRESFFFFYLNDGFQFDNDINAMILQGICLAVLCRDLKGI